jgi:hypothetical protein
MIFLLIADLIYANTRCVLVLLHPISTGVNHVPIKAVATTVNNVATSGGIGGGGALISQVSHAAPLFPSDKQFKRC